MHMHCDVLWVFTTAFMSTTLDLHLQKSEQQNQMQYRKEPQHTISLLSVDSTAVKFILFYFLF
jgi:hypothetical protein